MASKATQYRCVPPALFERRCESRHVVHLTRASVRRRGEQPVEGRLHDVSIYGCRVACPAGHRDGARLWVRLAGGMPIAATVIWSGDGFVGCRFDAPIAKSTVRTLTLTAG